VELSAFRPAGEAERDDGRARLDVQPGAFLVLAVGRLVAKKGFGFLVRAMPTLIQEHETARLVVAGAGDLEQELRSLARSIGVSDSVVFLGDVDRRRLPELYAAADVLAVPSIHDSAGNVDGLPNVVLEGLASGLPLVASRVAGIPDVIRDGANGLLVPEQDSESLALALGRLAVQPELRQRLGRAARLSAEDALDWHSITRRYAEVLRGVAGTAS
jgi:glycosyltransferase involved in cell wall biosynthesis